MKRSKMIKIVLVGLALLVLILADINFSWWMRGYLAFGGEGLLYIIAIVWYVRSVIKEIKNERVHKKTAQIHQ